MNEKGSSLLFVLLIIVIFSLLGLTVLGAAVHNIKRTEYREYEVETTASSKAIMNEIIIALEEKFDPNQNEKAKNIRNILKEYNQPEYTIYDTTVDKIINDIQSDYSKNYPNYAISLTELSEEEYKNYLNIKNIAQFKKENFMRIYNIRIKYNHSESEDFPAVHRTIEQNVILSPTPSFLNYAVGVGVKNNKENDGRLVINGSPDIVGNVFAPTLELNSRAKYVKDDTSYTSGEFFGPSIYGTLFTSQIENKRETVPNETNPYFFEGNFEEDISGIPAIQPLSKYFVDMDFWATYIRKRTDSKIPIPEKLEDVDTTSDDIEEKATAPIPVSELTCFDSEHVFYDYLEAGLLSEQHLEVPEEFDINKIMDYDEAIRDPDNNTTLAFSDGENFYLLEESMLETYQSEINDFFEQVQNTNSVIYFTNIDQRNKDNEPYFYNNYKKSAETVETPNVLTIDQSLKLKNDEQEKGWLVVDGTLVLHGVPKSEKDKKEKVEIVSNILVNGDLYIQSENKNEDEDESEDLYFDSTIYVTGNAFIENVNIHGAEDENGNEKQLVLITNGDLKIVRINEYEDVEEDKSLYNLINNPPNLKAFFYTNQSATLYGVGSLFQIEGGVFARKNLTINAIRGNIDHINEASTAQSFSTENEKNTRFFVEYDTRVLIDQLNALPIVDRLQVIPDKMNISQ